MDGAMIITIMMGLICIFGKVSRTFEDATYIMLIWFGMYLLVDGIRKKESLFPVLIYGGGVIILLFRLFRVPGW